MPSAWPGDAEELRQEQRRLAALSPAAWCVTPGARVGACFVCFAEDSSALEAGAEPAWAAAVTFEAGRRVAAAVVEGSTAAAYQAGLLALRAGPLLAAAVTRLQRPPDVLLVNATGRDHPRRAGLALHLGAVVELPTVGVTDRPLAAADAVGDLSGGPATRTLRLDGCDVAALARVGPGRRGVWAHAAWRTDAATAFALVRAIGGSARTPAPLREARRLARTARAWAQGAAPYPPNDPRPWRW